MVLKYFLFNKEKIATYDRVRHIIVPILIQINLVILNEHPYFLCDDEVKHQD